MIDAALLGSLDSVAAAVERLDGRFLLPALALQLANLGLRGLAWRNVIAAAYPGRPVPRTSVAAGYAAGVALNGFVPARGGDAAKVLLVARALPGTSIATVAASLSVLVAFDALLGGSLVVGLWASGALPTLPALGMREGVLAAAAGVAFLGVVGASRRLRSVRVLLRQAARGLAVLRTPGRYVRTVVPLQVMGWACRVGVVLLVLAAFRIEAGLETAALVVVLGGVSSAVPVPGGAGAQQIVVVYALAHVASLSNALAFSVGLQVGITAVNGLVGLAAAMMIFRTLSVPAAVRSGLALARATTRM
jgi:hypothetical protein